MQLLRKKVSANTITEFKFDVNAYDFLVKNLTDDYIYICFNEFNENQNIKIPSYKSQVITMNTNHTNSKYATNILSIKSNIEGEVEIQCLTY